MILYEASGWTAAVVFQRAGAESRSARAAPERSAASRRDTNVFSEHLSSLVSHRPTETTR